MPVSVPPLPDQDVKGLKNGARGFYNSRMPTRLIRKHCALDGAAGVSAKHIAEAVQYRSMDRDYWT
jgi:hypothetical protein